MAVMDTQTASLCREVRRCRSSARLAVRILMRRFRKKNGGLRFSRAHARSLRHANAEGVRLRLLLDGSHVWMVVFYLFETIIFLHMQEQMLRILATQYALYTKIWGFHWNLVGTDFAERHGLYGDWKDGL